MRRSVLVWSLFDGRRAINSHIDQAAHDTGNNQIAAPGQRQDKFEAFLIHLAESSNVTRSATNAGLHPSAIYHKRRQDPAFARKWLSALYEGYLHLEMEVVRRLREGEMQGRNKDKYDFANAIRLLTVHRENAARAQAEQRNVDAAAVRASIDRKIEDIRQQVQLEKGREGNCR